jgi:hypothetical protein
MKRILADGKSGEVVMASFLARAWLTYLFTVALTTLTSEKP